MKKKINAKFMLISALAIIVTGACAMLLFYTILKEQIFDDLKANAHVVSMLEVEQVKEELHYDLSKDGLRITFIDADGTVIFDSELDEASMENHSKREEIVEAFETGEGKALRKSTTSSKHTFYYAMKKEDGSILRIAKDSSSIYSLLINMGWLVADVGLGVFILCMIVANRLTTRILSPIGKMASNITMVNEEEVYAEMRPFVSMIKQQHIDILKHAQIRQEFTANVSHELKTPLTAISGYAELIENGMTQGADTVHFAGEIHRSAERLQGLINDIIKLSELDDESLKMEFEAVDLYEIAENCQKMLAIAAEKNEVTVSVSGEHAIVTGNKTLLEELIYNLGSNAVRYNKKGGSVEIIIKTENEHSIMLVKDTGIGIPKESQERIFERFYRVDKSRSKSTGGTGLGLAIVKHIVARHDAEISLESEEGVGTEIKVIF